MPRYSHWHQRAFRSSAVSYEVVGQVLDQDGRQREYDFETNEWNYQKPPPKRTRVQEDPYLYYYYYGYHTSVGR